MPENAPLSPSFRQLLRNIAGALRLAWRASRRGFVVTSLLAVGTGVISPFVVWLTKRLVDLTVTGAARGVRPGGLGITIVALGVLGAATRVFVVLQSHRQSLFGERVEMYAVRRFLHQAASVDLGYFDNSDWHDRMQRAEEGLAFRPFQLTMGVTGLAGAAGQQPHLHLLPGHDAGDPGAALPPGPAPRTQAGQGDPRLRSRPPPPPTTR
ncbi:MAG: hypothetical protein ACRDZ3_07905 [Acidimicrobiia bacterium]